MKTYLISEDELRWHEEEDQFCWPAHALIWEPSQTGAFFQGFLTPIHWYRSTGNMLLGVPKVLFKSESFWVPAIRVSITGTLTKDVFKDAKLHLSFEMVPESSFKFKGPISFAFNEPNKEPWFDGLWCENWNPFATTFPFIGVLDEKPADFNWNELLVSSYGHQILYECEELPKANAKVDASEVQERNMAILLLCKYWTNKPKILKIQYVDLEKLGLVNKFGSTEEMSTYARRAACKIHAAEISLRNRGVPIFSRRLGAGGGMTIPQFLSGGGSPKEGSKKNLKKTSKRNPKK